MRQLTFKGFLEPYVRYLADKPTSSFAELAPLTRDRRRLVEPLVLLAVETGRARALSRALADRPSLLRELNHLETLRRAGKLERALSDPASELRTEYKKVWSSYVARRDAHLRDEDLKRAARARVLDLEKAGHVTRYRMAKDLGLNPGNLHAFLAQGNVQKLSLDRVYALVNYVQSAPDKGKRGRVGTLAHA